MTQYVIRHRDYYTTPVYLREYTRGFGLAPRGLKEARGEDLVAYDFQVRAHCTVAPSLAFANDVIRRYLRACPTVSRAELKLETVQP